MNKRKMKTLAWSTAVLTLTLAVTACTGGGKNDPAVASPSASAATASPQASEDAVDSSPEASAAETPAVHTAEGDFVGMIDGHSIEIKLDGTASPFQIDPETSEKVAAWDEGTKVKFQYREDTLDVDGQQVKQLTIIAIDKA